MNRLRSTPSYSLITINWVDPTGNGQGYGCTQEAEMAGTGRPGVGWLVT